MSIISNGELGGNREGNFEREYTVRLCVCACVFVFTHVRSPISKQVNP